MFLRSSKSWQFSQNELLFRCFKNLIKHSFFYRKYGVDKIYKLEQGLKPSNAQRIFLVPCNLAVCKTVLDQIHSELARYSKLSLTPGQPCHHLLVAPMLPTILSNIAEEEGT